MACISKEEVNLFKEFCKIRKIKDNFVNYIAWKDRYMRNTEVIK
ncbi:hypothetical protein ACQPUZ_04700 [Clostridium tertium]